MTAPLRKITSCYRTSIRHVVNIPTPAPTTNHGRRRARQFHNFSASNYVATTRPIGSAVGTSAPDCRTICSSIGSVHRRGSSDVRRGHRSSSSSANLSPSKSFKRVIRPFLMACHPDATTAGENAAGRHRDPSRRARSANLAAVQTINGLVDVLDELIGRCAPTSGRSAGSLPELKARYEIEFVLPTTVPEDDGPVRRKRGDRNALSLRSMTVSFPERLRTDVKKWALTTFPDNPHGDPHPREEEALRVAARLRDHALDELLRLLSIAGMRAPASSVDEARSPQPRENGAKKEESQWTLSDHFLHDLGIDPADDAAAGPPTPSRPRGQSLAFFGRMQSRPTHAAPPASHLDRQRQAFVRSVPWDRFAEDYDRAFLDARADWTTSRLGLYDAKTVGGRERREEFVSRICGSVEIRRQAADDDAGDDAGEGEESEGQLSEEIPEGLDVVAQLIAIRRLSLLLYDNFDHLQMERMGRMWERLVIVLTPPRGSGDAARRGGGGGGGDEAPFRRRGKRKKLNKWERRMKAREKRAPKSRGRMRHVAQTLLEGRKGREGEGSEGGPGDVPAAGGGGSPPRPPPDEGFKFSYGTRSDQGTGHATAHVPIDFRDGELVGQLYTHLYDYFDTCCGRPGFLRYGADGEVGAAASFGKDADSDVGGFSGDEDDDEEDRIRRGGKMDA